MAVENVEEFLLSGFVADATFANGVAAYQHLRSENFNSEALGIPGTWTEIPFPGIGPVGARPGGAIRFIGNKAVNSLLKMFEEGAPIHVAGPKGVGKSCVLRAVAATLINESDEADKVLCIWNMEWALYNLVDALRNALLFAYCEFEDVCQRIQLLTSVEDVCAFIRDRRGRVDERFYFIVDGVQVLDAERSDGEQRDDAVYRRERKMELNKVVLLGHSYIYGLSPAATDIVDQSASVNRFKMYVGLDENSFATFFKESVLGSLCEAFPERKKDVDYYGGHHPLSLFTLDRSCRKYARRVLESEDVVGAGKKRRRGFPQVKALPDNERTLECISEPEDWDRVLLMFMQSNILSAVAKDCANVVDRRGLFGLYKLGKMVSSNKRYALCNQRGDPVDYCTGYIRELHIRGFRQAEEGRFAGGAWPAYCEYLLKNPTGINWSEMGWLCGHLFSDALTHSGGMLIEGVHIQGNIRVLPFTTPPSYESWIQDLQNKVVDGIVFLPQLWNLRAIDGAVVFKDPKGELHFFALQATTNEKAHLHSAGEFMNLGVVGQWIRFEEKRLDQGGAAAAAAAPESVWKPRDDWKLHYVFVCLNKEKPVLVDPVIRRLPSGKYFGNAGYTLHTVKFQDAFAHTINTQVHDLLQAVAMKREPLALAPRGAPASSVPVAGSLLEGLLHYCNKDTLVIIAKDYGMDTSGHRKVKKPDFIQQMLPHLKYTYPCSN